MHLSKTAAEVITLAAAIRDYWNTELPKRHRNYPIVSAGEDSGPAPPEEAKLRELLKSLREDDIYKLLLLMYLGRGDFGTDNLSAGFETLKKRFPNTDRAISQMMEKAALADYLTDGMAEVTKSGSDVDHLSFAPVTAGS